MNSNPIYIYILCEGCTEETFVKRILQEHFSNINIHLIPILLGGVSKYKIIKRDIQNLCKSGFLVTTMLDYYGLPSDSPGIHDKSNSFIYEKIQHIEEKMKEDISCENFYPNLMVHEFESILFSNPQCFEICGFNASEIKKLVNIKEKFSCPEYINNSQQTAPSKRILQISNTYQKVTDGYLVAEAIGLETIRNECPHFNLWIRMLESFAMEN